MLENGNYVSERSQQGATVAIVKNASDITRYIITVLCVKIILTIAKSNA